MKSFPVVTASQMRHIDHLTTTRYGMPVLLLMENAGRAVARTTQSFLKRTHGRKVTVLCGSGHNGGDGVVAARYLHQWGYRCHVIWIKNPARWEGDVGLHYRISKRFGIPFKPFNRTSLRTLREADVLIDALLGTGIHGEVQSPYYDAIARMNESRRPLIAVDIPSGLDANQGIPLGIAVKAHTTVTMAAVKKGLLKAPARPYVGHLIVADIGIPRTLLRRINRVNRGPGLSIKQI